MLNVVHELLTLYFVAKANSYTRYLVWLLTISGAGLLVAANFLYFFNDDHEIGLYLLLGSILIGSAVILHLVSILSGKKMASRTLGKIESSPSILMDIGLRQLHRFIPGKNISFLASTIIPIAFLAFMMFKKKAGKHKL